MSGGHRRASKLLRVSRARDAARPSKLPKGACTYPHLGASNRWKTDLQKLQYVSLDPLIADFFNTIDPERTLNAHDRTALSRSWLEFGFWRDLQRGEISRRFGLNIFD